MIYHVVSKAGWEQALAQGYYEHPSLKDEGFIHACSKSQVNGVLERYYKKQHGLLLLHINENTLTAPLKYEMAPSVNEEFPHIYGALNIDAVVDSAEII